MAVVNVLSSSLTNRDTQPVQLNNARINGSPVKHARAVFTITNGDSAASTYRLFELPSNALPVSIRVSAPDIGTTTTFNVGLYDTTKNGGLAVSAALFAAPFVVNVGPYAKVEIGYTVTTLANAEKTIWQLLGLAADSTKNYDFVATLVGAADATGLVLIEVDYTI